MQGEEMIAKDMLETYCIVRTGTVGVHAGTLEARDGQEVLLSNARRIWYWSGSGDIAATLSQLAVKGTAVPKNCKFTAPVPKVLLLGATEVIPCTEVARISIEKIPNWTG